MSAKIILLLITVFSFKQSVICQEDPYYSEKGWQLVETETKFVLNNGLTSADAENNFGKPDEKSNAEFWGADGSVHQTWYYKSKGLEIDFYTDDSKVQKAASIKITNPSEIKTSRGIGIGSTREEVQEAYKDEIDKKNKWSGKENLVAGTEFGGVIFSLESGKVASIFIGAAAE